MFEDSLVESTGRVRTQAQRYLAGSFLVEAALATTLVLLPYLFPQALPRKFLTLPLIAPPPPAAPVPPEPAAATPARSEFLQNALIAPSRIPTRISSITDAAPPGLNITGLADLGGSRNGVQGLPNLAASTPPPAIHPVPPATPLRVSAGVAAGQLLVPIQPEYPAIALAARVQGTVIVDAFIGKNGRIASVHVVSGPPLLVGAAIAAIQRARYRPWILNGQPVEVLTTIHIVFTLGDTHQNARNAPPGGSLPGLLPAGGLTSFGPCPAASLPC